MNATARVILIILLVFLLLGLMPVWPYSSNWGYGWYPSGGIGLLLLIVLIIILLGSRRDRLV